MPPTRAADAATLRGCAVGALTAALAVAGHGYGGGGYPTSAALTLLVLCCGGVGALAGSLTASRAALVATLAGGQVLGHLVLSATLPHPHADLGARGTSMLAAHAVATAVCGVLILAAEKLYGPITRALRVLFRGPAPATARSTGRPVPFCPVTFSHLRLDHVISRRGPPAAI